MTELYTDYGMVDIIGKGALSDRCVRVRDSQRIWAARYANPELCHRPRLSYSVIRC